MLKYKVFIHHASGFFNLFYLKNLICKLGLQRCLNWANRAGEDFIHIYCMNARNVSQ